LCGVNLEKKKKKNKQTKSNPKVVCGSQFYLLRVRLPVGHFNGVRAVYFHETRE
jgi:hypothetical protein